MRLALLRRVAAVLGAVLLVVLAVTGAWLWFRYRPTAAQAWNDVLNPQLQDVQRLRIVHRLASQVLVWDVAAYLLLVVVDRGVRRRWPLGAWSLVVALVASFTGFLLPWDQLALWSVTVGTDMRGMVALWDNDVRFVLIDGVEVAPTTIRRWSVVHVLVPVVAIAATAVVWTVSRRRPRRAPDPTCSTTTSRT